MVKFYSSIAYASGYKYQLRENYAVNLNIKPKELIKTDFLIMKEDGTLIILRGYAWDGPSGPVPDGASIMRGSLIHDALYQLIRAGLLPESARELADKALKEACLEDGMNRLKAWLVYKTVRLFGGPSARPEHENPTLYAPA